MRKTLQKQIAKVFGRRDNRDGDQPYVFPYYRNDNLQRGVPLPLSRRRIGYNAYASVSQGAFKPQPEGQVLQLSHQTQKFVNRITAAGLSHLLIWYCYHDVVPRNDNGRHWYLELPRDEMLGWIRLGFELARDMTRHTIRQLPLRIQQAIDELGIDARTVTSKLIRLSNERDMRQHEMIDIQLTDTSSYLVAGEKLEADRDLVASLRPIPRTVWADWQDEILNWIEKYMEVVIRPAIDHNQSIPQLESSQRESRRHIHALFKRVCSYHHESPLSSMYSQALASIGWNHANELVATRDHMIERHEAHWLGGHFGPNPHTSFSPYAPGDDHDRRRKSAPILHENKNMLMDLQDEVESMRADLQLISVHCMLDEDGPRAQALRKLMKQQKGLATRARVHLENTSQELQDGVASSIQTGGPAGQTEDEWPSQRKSRGVRLPRALSNIFNYKASKSTPDLCSHDLRSGTNGDLDSEDDDEPRQNSGETAVEQRIFSISPTTNGLPTPVLGSPFLANGNLDPDRSSVQLSDPDDTLHRGSNIRPLEVHGRNGLTRRLTGRPLPQSPAPHIDRADSQHCNAPQSSADQSEGHTDPEIADDQTSERIVSIGQASRRIVTFGLRNTMGSVEAEIGTMTPTEEWEVPDLPEKSRFRLSGTSFSGGADLIRSQSLSLPARQDGTGSFGIATGDGQVGSSSASRGRKRQVRVVTPTVSSIGESRSSSELEEYKQKHSEMSEMIKAKEKPNP